MAWLTMVLGSLLALGGLLLSLLPGLLVEPKSAADPHASIEQRTHFGACGGFGIGLALLRDLGPWYFALSHLAFWTTIGFFSSRLLGLLFDGMDKRQLLWLGVEALATSALAYYIWGR